MDNIISIFFNLYYYFKIFMSFVTITYFYKQFFDKCITEKECVFVSKKTNKKKIKIVQLPKRMLTFVYFSLIGLIYYYFNFHVMVCLVCLIAIIVISLFQKFDESFIEILYMFDEFFIIKALYFGFYWLCKSIFFIFSPIYKRLENKKKNNYDSLKNTLINRLSNTEYGGMLQLLGYSNKNTGKTNNDMGNIMNLFGDMGELKKLFNDSESTSKSSNKNNDKNNDKNNKILDPKWLEGHITSTEDLDKYLLSEIASNKDLKRIANLNNNKIIELNADNTPKDNINKDNINKDNVKKDNINKDKKDNINKNSKKDKKDKNEKNSEELVNLFKKMNDVFSTMSIKNNKEISENSG